MLKLKRETENSSVSDEARISMKAVVLMATALPAPSHWEVKVGGTRGSEKVRGTELA